MKRYDQLDSLRGLASLAVLIGHFLIVIPNMLEYTYGEEKFQIMNLFKYTPLYIIRSGYESVFLFFVLSGFVLSLQFYKNKNINYFHYVIRRFFRVYIPYIVSIAIALLLVNFIKPIGIPELSDWFNSIWNEPITLGMIFEYIIMIFGVENSAINTVLWTLVYEIDISLLFPFMMFFLMRFHWAISLFGNLSLIIFLNFYLPGNTISNLSLYTFMFVCGALIAKHSDTLISYYQSLTKLGKTFYIFATFSFYLYAIFLVDVPWIHSYITNELIIVLGASMLVILSLSSKLFSKFLLKKPFLFLGKISFSLYLYHTLVLFSMIHILYNLIPMWIIWIISFIITLIVSHFSEKYIETPANNYGKSIVKRLNTKTTDLLVK